jgi:hypothetical protein
MLQRAELPLFFFVTDGQNILNFKTDLFFVFLLLFFCFVAGLHLRSSGDDCRMPAEGGVPSSESAHRERLQKHNNHAGHGSSYYDPEYARMEAWLDEHPDFVQDYFLRYMTECCDVERWRISMRPRCHPQIRHDPRRVPFKEQVDKLNVNSSELLRFFRFRITGNGLRKKQREFMVGQS